MKKGWETKPLGELCSVLSGLWKGKKAPFQTATVIRNTNFSKDCRLDLEDVAVLEVESRQLAKRRLQAGDLILEKSGGGPKQAVGRIVYFDKKDGVYSFSNFTSVLRVTDPSTISPLYLHRYLFWQYMAGVTEPMQRRSTGIRNLDMTAYMAIPIQYPPLPEQRRIVAILDEAFEGIAAAKANAEQNLRRAREIADSTTQLLLSRVPSDAVDTTVGAEVDLLAGFAFKSQGYTTSEDGMRLLRGDNIVPGGLRWDDVKRWPNAHTSEYERYVLAEDDVVLAMDRPWVSAGLKRSRIAQDDLPCLLVQRVARLRAKPGLDSGFLYHILGTRRFINHLLDGQTGTGVPHISGKQIADHAFAKPSLAHQKRTTKRIDALLGNTGRFESIVEAKLANLDELKASLLHQAFTGEL